MRFAFRASILQFLIKIVNAHKQIYLEAETLSLHVSIKCFPFFFFFDDILVLDDMSPLLSGPLGCIELVAPDSAVC